MACALLCTAAMRSAPLLLCIGLATAACSSSAAIKATVQDGANDQASGSGGNGTGGNSSGAGGSGAGGITSTGGGTSSGGVTGAGGTTSTAGTNGTGGAASTGGVTGAGGARSTGGSGSGSGGTMILDASAEVHNAKSGDLCRSQTDCGSAGWLRCYAPGQFRGCGTCRTSTNLCVTDADCLPDGGGTSAKQICNVAPSSYCYCTGVQICQPGCRVDADCPSGSGCNAQHACQKTCVGGDGTCGPNFVCGSDGFCAQTRCTADSDCSGACVNGGCYGATGTCEMVPA